MDPSVDFSRPVCIIRGSRVKLEDLSSSPSKCRTHSHNASHNYSKYSIRVVTLLLQDEVPSSYKTFNGFWWQPMHVFTQSASFLNVLVASRLFVANTKLTRVAKKRLASTLKFSLTNRYDYLSYSKAFQAVLWWGTFLHQKMAHVV